MQKHGEIRQAPNSHKIKVFIDGYCKMCSSLATFVGKRDQAKQFEFFDLESLEEHGSDFEDNSRQSLVVMHQSFRFEKSKAVLYILKHLGEKYSTLSKCLNMMPQSFLDLIYDLISKSRYFLFGKHKVCAIPTKKEPQKTNKL